MKKVEFIELFVEELEIEDSEVVLETELESLDEWDSMAVLSVIAIADENFNSNISAQQLKDVKTVSDIVSLIGLQKFDD